MFRPGRDESPLWYIGCILSLVFLCAWEYCTIAMSAPWFFLLFGGVLLCGEALELAGALLEKRRAKEAKGAREAQNEKEPLARPRALADGARRLMMLLFLLAWTGIATYAALTAHISPAVWLFPAAGLVMLAVFIATGGALRGEGERATALWAPQKGRPAGDAPDGEGGQPPHARSLRAMMPDPLLALLGLMFAALWLTLAVPAGAPWAACLASFAVAAAGVVAAIVNARKASAKDAADGAPCACPRCEAIVPAGESVCPCCGKCVRAGKAKTGA